MAGPPGVLTVAVVMVAAVAAVVMVVVLGGMSWVFSRCSSRIAVLRVQGTRGCARCRRLAVDDGEDDGGRFVQSARLISRHVAYAFGSEHHLPLGDPRSQLACNRCPCPVLSYGMYTNA